ncbi:MAG: monovalent cation/H+ antiporter complex subunit F [Planctomycetota bacterium]
MIPEGGDPGHWLFIITSSVLALGVAASLVRLVQGPTLADRVVALDLIGFLLLGVLAAFSIVTQRPSVLFVVVVAALILFLGTAAFAIYLDRRWKQ